MKKLVFFALAALTIFASCERQTSATAPSGSTSTTPAPAAGGSTLTVWSFTDEIDQMMNKPEYGYVATHPDVTVTYSMTPTNEFQSKLDPVLASGQGTPDVFALEDSFVRKYVESGLLLDLTDVYEANKDKLIAYPVQVGSDGGRVYGLSWQAAPGAVFYRRSLATKYFGTDDPAAIQEKMKDQAAFLAACAELKTKSNGGAVMISALGDLQRPFEGGRKQPFVVDNKLVIDPAIEAFFDIAKIMHENNYEGRVGQWSEGWFAGMNGSLTDENGNPIEVFCYFLPTWGLHYTLKPNAGDTVGDWAMIPGPYAYRWGGTWLGAYKDTKNAAAAKDFIAYLTTNDNFLEKYALESGDVVSNLAVVNKIKDTFTEPFLGGQNHYAEFAEMATKVDGSLTQGTDLTVEATMMEELTAFANGEKSKADALADWKSAVSAQLGLDE